MTSAAQDHIDKAREHLKAFDNTYCHEQSSEEKMELAKIEALISIAISLKHLDQQGIVVIKP